MANALQHAKKIYKKLYFCQKPVCGSPKKHCNFLCRSLFTLVKKFCLVIEIKASCQSGEFSLSFATITTALSFLTYPGGGEEEPMRGGGVIED